MHSSGGEMEAVEKAMRDKRMEEREKREAVMEERMAKKEKEEEAEKAKKAAMIKAAKEFVEATGRKILEKRGGPQDPWDQFRGFWTSVWGEGGYFGKFEDETTIPSMRFTFSGDGSTKNTLQFFSVKVAEIDQSLQWPLHVYGFFSVRDVVDHKRNMIFSCDRDNCQTISQEDPYLTLTGPTRAVVVSSDPSYFEIELKVKGTAESEDKYLSRLVMTYRTGFVDRSFTSELSTLEMAFEEIIRSVEATISVKVVGGSWPDGFRGVFCASIDDIAGLKVKLLECGDDRLPLDADGNIKLRCKVVSVGLEGLLRISVMAHCINGDQVVESHCREDVKSHEVVFEPRRSGTSSSTELKIGSCRMEVTVNWSLFSYQL
ncbi:uncharacterized protein LOC119364645 [Triticum dicoccoides]|uniref:uncharacterized protein LOC119364645 n=1 Tax=Triticum dicoccoides TaxID=85692 RepID=UPI00188EEFC3|nr:uncharacterized protein LOC119364645 [Triticum dicoccoides]